MTALTVLYADDGPESGPFGDSFDLVHAPSVAAARDRIDSVDCVVSTYSLPDGTAFDLFETARETAPDIPCILWADLSTEFPTRPGQPVVEAVDRDADPDHVADVVRSAVEARSHAAYPLPDDEDDRLAALDAYDVVELADESTFDRLARLAAQHLGVPAAFVTLVGEHEEQMLGRYGADVETLARQETVCTYTLLQENPFAVEDLDDDPRFSSLEVLRDQGFRSYLGVRLTTPDGHALGTFCVCDRRPRTFTDDARESLQLFAAEAVEQLELRYQLRERGADPETFATETCRSW